MAYNKLISYGDFVELYEYEGNLPQYTKFKREDDNRHDDPGLDSSGDNSDSECQEQDDKRKDNVRRAVLGFRRLVGANLRLFDRPILATFTYREEFTDVSKGYEDFKYFIRNARKQFKVNFRAIYVPEFQKRGALHYHAFIWDLPDSVVAEERSTRLVAKLWGKGYVDLKVTDGNPKLISYLCKYMAKSFSDKRLLGKRAYSCTYNVLRPIINKGVPLWFAFDEFIGVDNSPLRDSKISSLWLGEGRYRLFNINNSKLNERNVTNHYYSS